MKRSELRQLAAYVLVATFAIGGAFLISLQFMGKSGAQEPPPVEAPATEPAAPEAAATPAAQEAPAAPEATAAPEAATQEKGSGMAELEGFLEPFIYDVVNRRDPFLAYADYIPNEEGPSRPLSPAQRFALEELKLVGIMWDIKDPKAMFMDPQKEVLMLGRDESVGNRNGYIAAIREGEVVVVESLRKRGEIIYRTRVLRIER